MKIEDINSFADLEVFIRLEIARQTKTKKSVQLELNEKWFFKFAQLIVFSLKTDPTEKHVSKEIDKDCKKYLLKINRVFTIVTRR